MKRRLSRPLSPVVLVRLLAFAGLWPALLANAQSVWMPTGGPPGGDVEAIILAPGGDLLASTRLGGVFRSSDLGETWVRTDITSGDEYISDFDMNAQGHLFGASTLGVKRSTDGGVTWDLLTEGLTSTFTTAIDVAADGLVYAGTYFEGMFRSENNGDTWTDANNGLTNLRVNDIAFGPNSSIYAATDDGIFLSQDGGGSWTDISGGLSSRFVRSVFVDGEGVVWAGAARFSKKTDPQSDWEETDGRAPEAIDTTSTGRLIGAACETFVYSDDGESWFHLVPEPRPFLCLSDFAVVGDIIFAASRPRGVFRSDDDGATWRTVNAGLDASNVRALTVTETSVIAGSPQGILRSDDGGATWSRHIDGLSRVYIYSLLETSDGRLLAGTNWSGHGLFESVDDGITWAPADSSFAGTAYRLAQAPNGDLFVGGGGVVYRSQGGLASFDTVDAGYNSRQIRALGVSPAGSIFAAAYQFVRRSTDGGTTWEDVTNGLPDNPSVTDFVFLPGGDAVAAEFAALYRLEQGGDTWTKFADLPSFGPRDVVLDENDIWYVGFEGGGVAWSDDDGMTWNMLNDGLNDLSVNKLVLVSESAGGESSGKILYAATGGGGVSVFAPLTVATRPESPGDLGSSSLGANYPNPFSSLTLIPLTLQRASDVSFSVFDMLGRRVIRQEYGRLQAGEHVLDVDGSGLASGVYLLVVDVDGVTVRRLLTRSE